MQDQPLFDAIADDVVPESSATPHLLLDCALRIRGCNRPFERVTMRARGELIGQRLFDAFPDNPGDPQAHGTEKVIASMETAMRSGRTHNMWVQRYDIADPSDPGSYVSKVWRPATSPLYDHHQLIGLVHRVEEITDLDAALSAMGEAADAGDAMPAAEQLHTLAALTAAPPERPREQVLAAENEQLQLALATRDLIGQAKGILMERYTIDATDAFDLLVKLSQEKNIRLAEIACRLVEIDHPPSPRRGS